MIVISGALVLVALVLLVIGIASKDLAFVYGSIGVSLVSLVFLAIGIFQRRGETFPETDSPASDTAEPGRTGATDAVPVRPVTSTRSARDDDQGRQTRSEETGSRSAVAADSGSDADDQELEYGGTVLVVAGRPRYHVEGCRYLTGKASEQLDVLDAREEGFTPCGVCRPDAALADAPVTTDQQVDEPLPMTLGAGEPADSAPSPARPATRALPDVQDRGAVSAEPADDRPSDEDVAAPAAPVSIPAVEAPADPAPAVVASEDVAPVDVAPVDVAPVDVASEDVAPEDVAPVDVAPEDVAPVDVAPVDVAPEDVAPVDVAPAKKAPARRAAARTAPARTAPARTASARTSPSAPAPAGPATEGGSDAAAGSSLFAIIPAPAPEAATSGPRTARTPAPRAGSVVVIPDRGRFHRADCRYVRGVGGAEVLSRAAASKKGYDACGVCKP